MPYCKTCGNELPEGAQFCPKCGTIVSKLEKPIAVKPAPKPTVVAPGLKSALWGERFVAWLIDVVIIAAVFGILNLVAFLGGPSFSLIPGWPDWIPFFNLNSVVLFLYWMLMEGSSGQSVGKMVMRLKVVHVDGTQVNLGNAAVESVGKAFLLPLDCLLGWILYPRSRQRLFNHISRTIVVRLY